jgi:hypothetical protein
MVVLPIEEDVELLVDMGRNRDDQDSRASVIPPESKPASVGIPPAFDRSKTLRGDI